MSSYTIKSGDCLWNICKREYKLTSNADILKKVKEVAAANNMNVNDTIFAGKTLQLASPENETESSESAATNPVKNKAQLAAAERIGYNNIQSYEDLNTLANSSVSIFGSDVKTDAQKNQAYLDYSNELLLNYYDEHKDGTVTVEEFTQKEQASNETVMKLTQGYLAENGVTSTAEDKARDQRIAQRSAALFAQNLDFNGNGKIDASELAFFNENADEIDGAKDGVIKNAGESAMFGAVTGMNAGNQEYNRVVNKYLLGETLTPEEQQTLKACQNTIRTNMAKAAGLNING